MVPNLLYSGPVDILEASGDLVILLSSPSEKMYQPRGQKIFYVRRNLCPSLRGDVWFVVRIACAQHGCEHCSLETSDSARAFQKKCTRGVVVYGCSSGDLTGD